MRTFWFFNGDRFVGRMVFQCESYFDLNYNLRLIRYELVESFLKSEMEICVAKHGKFWGAFPKYLKKEIEIELN
jgi:hypothetical protein